MSAQTPTTPRVHRADRLSPPQTPKQHQQPRPDIPLRFPPRASTNTTTIPHSSRSSSSRLSEPPSPTSTDASDRASPSAKSSASNWQASIELSLNTRRRLIRKPLPQLPSDKTACPEGIDSETSDFLDPRAIQDICQKAEEWWPNTLPPKRETTLHSNDGKLTQSRLLPSDQDKGAVSGLDDQSIQHLLVILHFAALRQNLAETGITRSGTFKASSQKKETQSQQHLYVLDERILDSLFAALVEAFRHLSTKEVLGSLQRTASIRWRAEAQLRNATTSQPTEFNQETSSRWARFAWPAAALGRAYREAQRNVLPPLPGDPSNATNPSSYFQSNLHPFSASYGDHENRVRKRDVAVKILSNAVWFVRNYGPVAGVQSLPDPSAEDLAPPGFDLSSSISSQGLDPPTLSSLRRTSENLLKKNAGMPNFLAKSTPTTALSGTATPETEQSRDPPTSDPIPASSSSFSARATPLPFRPEGGATLSRSSSNASLNMTADSRSAVAVSVLPSPGEKSKAVEHLASLSAAAGASLRQKVQDARNSSSDMVAKTSDATGHSTQQPSRPSLASFVRRSEAEAAETDALEKAEREYQAMVGQGCDEWAKMVLCRICASIDLRSGVGKEGLGRSGTITAKDLPASAANQAEANKASTTANDEGPGSSFSTRSDNTIKAFKLNRDQQRETQVDSEDWDRFPLVWKPDHFVGDELFVQHSSDQQRRQRDSSLKDDEHVRMVGGSFVCQVRDEEEREALLQLLELAVFVGSSMLLEASFLRDSDAARPKLLKVPARTTSAVDTPQRGTSLVGQNSVKQIGPSRSNSDVSAEMVSKSIEQVLPAQLQEPHTETSPKGGARRWTKSLWGMLNHNGADQGPADVRTSSDREKQRDAAQIRDADSTRSASHSLQRPVRDDEKQPSQPPSNRPSFGLPRSKTVTSREEPRLSISSRRTSLVSGLSSVSSSHSRQASGHGREPSDPSTPSANSTRAPNRFVGRLFNAFVKPSSDDQGQSAQLPDLDDSKWITSSRSSIDEAADAVNKPQPRSKDSIFVRLAKKPSAKPLPPSVFPPKLRGPAPLSASPELSMLVCYQQDAKLSELSPSTYSISFYRLQMIRFLADQRRDLVTFATPSHGISASGELLPFVGVQINSTAKGNMSLTALRHGTQQQQQTTANLSYFPSPQLIDFEQRPAGRAVLGLRREEVAFYRRLSNSRDIPLGQLIEELGIRASAMEADGDTSALASSDAKASNISLSQPKDSNKERTDAASSKDRLRNSAYGTPEQRLQFIHGSFRIKVIATVLPQSMYDDAKAREKEQNLERTTAEVGTPGSVDAGSASVLPSLLASRSRDSDVSAVAAAVRTDKEVATTALAVAETAVQAAESGTRPLVDGKDGSASGIWMWNASAKSGWQGRAVPMSESTYLMSFAKYLEAIAYHPALRRAGGLEPSNQKLYGGLTNVQQQLREGKSEDSRSIAEGSNLLRLFRSGRALVKVHVQPIVIYDLWIEGPCLYTKKLTGQDKSQTPAERKKARMEKRKKLDAQRLQSLIEETRLEIQRFFASVKDQTTRLEAVFVSRELDESGKTIRKRPSALDLVNPEKLATSPAGGDHGGSAFSNVSGVSRASTATSSTLSGDVAEPLTLLSGMRSSLRTDEFELYDALQRTYFFDGVNDIRKAFADRAKSARNRLNAWIKKHLNKKEQAQLGKCQLDEPEYIHPGKHAFPGSSFIIREDEPLSIIAYSLSSRDFKAEIGATSPEQESNGGYMGQDSHANVMHWRTGVVHGQGTVGSQTSSATGSSTTSSSSLLPERYMRKVPMSQLDPDTDEVFYDPEPVQAALKRKKRGRESSILSLTLRRVGSTISESASNLTTPLSEAPPALVSNEDKKKDEFDKLLGRSSRIENGANRTPRSSVASAAAICGDQAQGSDTLNRQPGNLSRRTTASDLRSQASFSSIPDRKSSMLQSNPIATINSAAPTGSFQAQVVPTTGRPAPLANLFSSSKPTLDPTDERFNQGSLAHSTVAGKETPRSPSISNLSSTTGNSYWTIGHAQGQNDSKSARESQHKMAALQSASEGNPGADSHSMISNSTQAGSVAAESPHIKHNLIQGTTKISCVSWFAEEFAILRERWGVEHDFAQSLSRCHPWNTTGGKSKSAFFKTLDERFIAKQLLTVWSVDEKEAFLEFAPAYIRYMMNSAVNDCPTLLVKIAGVYSIKIKDTKSGETKLKMNVMILENLWAGDGGQSIRFDLKGIRDRKVKLTPQQQQSLHQAATNAALSGQTMMDIPGAAVGSPPQSSMTTMWNTGVQSVPSSAPGSNTGVVGKASAIGSRAAGGAGQNSQPMTSVKSRTGNDGESEQKPEKASTVWWDSEWIERFRHRAFVPETQKETFYRALQNDTQFLTASNVMDYSLLLGVIEKPIRRQDLYPAAATGSKFSTEKKDGMREKVAVEEEDAEGGDLEGEDGLSGRPSFRCRIVDFLGAFTLAKQLESSSKKALKAGQEAKSNVTILPPSEYATRFLSAMDSYFIGTPCQSRLDDGYRFDQQIREEAAAAGPNVTLSLPQVL